MGKNVYLFYGYLGANSSLSKTVDSLAILISIDRSYFLHIDSL